MTDRSSAEFVGTALGDMISKIKSLPKYQRVDAAEILSVFLRTVANCQLDFNQHDIGFHGDDWEPLVDLGLARKVKAEDGYDDYEIAWFDYQPEGS